MKERKSTRRQRRNGQIGKWCQKKPSIRERVVDNIKCARVKLDTY